MTWILGWVTCTGIIYAMIVVTWRKAYRKGFDRAKEIAIREIARRMEGQNETPES